MMTEPVDKPHPLHQRRTRPRVVFSCGHCRSGKLKCDRKSPCTQCERRGRSAEECVYEPLPAKMRKSRSIAARLDQIQGTVREMIQDSSTDRAQQSQTEGRVVIGGQGKSNYVGATHFMTVLDDLEDLKNFFDNSDSEDDDILSSTSSAEERNLDSFLLSQGAFKGKHDLLSILPPFQVLNSLVMHYFASRSPSTVVIHRPSFNNQYQSFCRNQAGASYEFLALIFMILAEATLFSSSFSFEDILAERQTRPTARVKAYRSAGIAALTAANYTSPSLETMAPMLLHLEAEFVLSRSTPIRCYLLSSTCIRLMLRLGLHRDPCHMPNISPFSGEMRRRMWHFGLQIEMLVSFQMGLPNMANGVESDTKLPRNINDRDLKEDLDELPPSRPDSETAPLTYFIWKTTIGQIFRSVAKKTNSPEPMSDTEVMRLDRKLEDVWEQVPSFLKVRPLEESITDDPLLVMERFSLASVYHKSQCVLHRNYLLKKGSGNAYSYSRSVCLRAALRLLECQKMHFEATRPGAMLVQFAWFLRPILMGDFLLAAMIVYISLQLPASTETLKGKSLDKPGLYRVLEESLSIWRSMAQDEPSYRKAANTVSKMLGKVERYRGPVGTSDPHPYGTTGEINNAWTVEGAGTHFPSSHQADANSMGIMLDPVLNIRQMSIQPTNELDFGPWLSSSDESFSWPNLDDFMRLDGDSQTWGMNELMPDSLPP
uniref:Zn(2)-C6 fungal-type domain-containing protein n=2 Tax=Bionectria ochroleuca TaxID=29856 RepID=A0A0B7K3G6_BIOOC